MVFWNQSRVGCHYLTQLMRLEHPCPISILALRPGMLLGTWKTSCQMLRCSFKSTQAYHVYRLLTPLSPTMRDIRSCVWSSSELREHFSAALEPGNRIKQRRIVTLISLVHQVSNELRCLCYNEEFVTMIHERKCIVRPYYSHGTYFL